MQFTSVVLTYYNRQSEKASFIFSSQSQNDDIDNDDDNEDSSFIILYKLNYDNKRLITSLDLDNLSNNKQMSSGFLLYENLIRCENIFEHDVSLNNLKYMRLYKATSCEHQDDNEDEDSMGSDDTNDISPSKILSIRTIKGICLQ